MKKPIFQTSSTPWQHYGNIIWLTGSFEAVGSAGSNPAHALEFWWLVCDSCRSSLGGLSSAKSLFKGPKYLTNFVKYAFHNNYGD